MNIKEKYDKLSEQNKKLIFDYLIGKSILYKNLPIKLKIYLYKISKEQESELIEYIKKNNHVMTGGGIINDSITSLNNDIRYIGTFLQNNIFQIINILIIKRQNAQIFNNYIVKIYNDINACSDPICKINLINDLPKKFSIRIFGVDINQKDIDCYTDLINISKYSLTKFDCLNNIYINNTINQLDELNRLIVFLNTNINRIDKSSLSTIKNNQYIETLTNNYNTLLSINNNIITIIKNIYETYNIAITTKNNILQNKLLDILKNLSNKLQNLLNQSQQLARSVDDKYNLLKSIYKNAITRNQTEYIRLIIEQMRQLLLNIPNSNKINSSNIQEKITNQINIINTADLSSDQVVNNINNSIDDINKSIDLLTLSINNINSTSNKIINDIDDLINKYNDGVNSIDPNLPQNIKYTSQRTHENDYRLSNKYSIYQGDCPGGDLYFNLNLPLQSCLTRCDIDPNCIGATVDSIDSSNLNICILKNKTCNPDNTFIPNPTYRWAYKLPRKSPISTGYSAIIRRTNNWAIISIYFNGTIINSQNNVAIGTFDKSLLYQLDSDKFNLICTNTFDKNNTGWLRTKMPNIINRWGDHKINVWNDRWSNVVIPSNSILFLNNPSPPTRYWFSAPIGYKETPYSKLVRGIITLCSIDINKPPRIWISNDISSILSNNGTKLNLTEIDIKNIIEYNDKNDIIKYL